MPSGSGADVLLSSVILDRSPLYKTAVSLLPYCLPM